MLPMPSPHAVNRLALVSPSRQASGRDSASVRRYRIARLRVEGDRRPGAARHAHLKRIYD